MTKIELLRLKQNLNKKELSKRAKIALSKVYLYESGKGNPTEKTLKKLANALNCEVRDLI